MTREEAITVLKAFMENPLFSEVHKAAFNIAIHDIKAYQDWNINKLMLVPKTEWEQEPTTKNDLGVGCIDRKKLIDWINIWDITPIIKNPLIRHIQGMPSVTPQLSSGLEKNSKKTRKICKQNVI